MCSKDALTERVLVMIKIENNTNSCQQQREALTVAWSPSFSDSLFPKGNPGFVLSKMSQQLLLPVIAIANWPIPHGSPFSSYTLAMTLCKHECFFIYPNLSADNLSF